MAKNITDYYFSFRELMTLQGRIMKPAVLTEPLLQGMVYREQDFTRSHAILNNQFATEYMIAVEGFSSHSDMDGLMNYVTNQLHLHDSGRIYTLGRDGFTTDSLAPALRHFLNDSCRLLEPLTPFMTKLTGSVKIDNKNSLISYIGASVENGMATFDAPYITELYELWNDYKHRNTGGLGVSGWARTTTGVGSPRLVLPNDSFKLLNDMAVSDFVVTTTSKIDELISILI